MTRFEKEHLGEIALADIAGALIVLKTMRGALPLSVGKAAKTFNTTPSLIREAVRGEAMAAVSARHNSLWLAGPDDEAAGLQFIELAA